MGLTQRNDILAGNIAEIPKFGMGLPCVLIWNVYGRRRSYFIVCLLAESLPLRRPYSGKYCETVAREFAVWLSHVCSMYALRRLGKLGLGRCQLKLEVLYWHWKVVVTILILVDNWWMFWKLLNAGKRTTPGRTSSMVYNGEWSLIAIVCMVMMVFGLNW